MPPLQAVTSATQEAMVIDSLTLQHYHSICHWELRQWRTLTISSCVTVNLGAVISWSTTDQLEVWDEVAYLLDVAPSPGGWYARGWYDGRRIGQINENGWTRYLIYSSLIIYD
jgi:hypothetical protein